MNRFKYREHGDGGIMLRAWASHMLQHLVRAVARYFAREYVKRSFLDKLPQLKSMEINIMSILMLPLDSV